LGEYFDAHKTKVPITIGYDLVEHNVTHLKKGNLTYLISQKPEEQAYKAIWALFNNLVSKKEVNKTNYSSIDIIIKENYDYYNENK
jgi:LacI family transcriptional regulator